MNCRYVISRVILPALGLLRVTERGGDVVLGVAPLLVHGGDDVKTAGVLMVLTADVDFECRNYINGCSLAMTKGRG